MTATTAQIADNLSRLASAKILVVGDVMLDRYWFGRVERISPEAPVPVVSVDADDERIGGAGNVACNITALGGACSLLAITGDDEARYRVRDIAAAAGISANLVNDKGAKTTIKLRVISRNQQLLRADFEAPPGDKALGLCTDRFAALVAKHQAVVVSDYGKGGVARVAELIACARDAGVPVLVDPKGGDFSRYKGADLVTPNLAEFEQAAGAVGGDDDLQKQSPRPDDAPPNRQSFGDPQRARNDAIRTGGRAATPSRPRPRSV